MVYEDLQYLIDTLNDLEADELMHVLRNVDVKGVKENEKR